MAVLALETSLFSEMTRVETQEAFINGITYLVKIQFWTMFLHK